MAAKTPPKRKAVKKVTTKKTAKAPPKAVVSNLLHIPGTDFNPRTVESVNGASRGEVGYESATEPRLESHLERVEENANFVSAHWQDRIRKEGIPYFTCPICPGTNQQKFTGKDGEKKCAAHIKKAHPARMKELKMTKAPKEMSQPKKNIQSPKRTIADAVHPKFRPMMEAQAKQRALLQPLTDHARSLTVQGSPLMKLVSMTESQAMQQIKKLNDNDLVALCQLASNRGKRLLARSARALCAEKGLNPEAKTRDPSARYMLIQEALKNANVPATIQRRG